MAFSRVSSFALVAPLFALALGCPAESPGDDNNTSVGPSSSITNPDDDGDDDGGESTTTSSAAETTTGEPPATSTGTDTGMMTSADDTNGGGQLCGDGEIDGSEQCDCGGMPCSPAGLGGAMCAGLTNPMFPDRVYTGGILDCNPASCQFKFTTCTFCGDKILNGNEICELGDEGPSCQDLGMGSAVDPLPCSTSCTWDTTCCAVPLPKECL